MDGGQQTPESDLRREINGYLDGTLTPDERAAFEMRLWTDVEARDALISEFRFRSLIEGGLAGDEPTTDPRACRRFSRLIGAYVRGRLEPNQTALLARHLNGCPTCAASYELASRHPTAARWTSPWTTAAGVLAAGILAVGIGYVAAPAIRSAAGTPEVTAPAPAPRPEGGMPQVPVPDDALPAFGPIFRLQSSPSGDGQAFYDAVARVDQHDPAALDLLATAPPIAAALDDLGWSDAPTRRIGALLISYLHDARAEAGDRKEVLRIICNLCRERSEERPSAMRAAPLLRQLLRETEEEPLFVEALARIRDLRSEDPQVLDLRQTYNRAIERRFFRSFQLLSNILHSRNGDPAAAELSLTMFELAGDQVKQLDLQEIGSDLMKCEGTADQRNRMAALATASGPSSAGTVAAIVLWRWTGEARWMDSIRAALEDRQQTRFAQRALTGLLGEEAPALLERLRSRREPPTSDDADAGTRESR